MSVRGSVPPWWNVEVEQDPVDGLTAVAISDGSAVEWLSPVAALEYAQRIETAARKIIGVPGFGDFGDASMATLRVETVPKATWDPKVYRSVAMHVTGGQRVTMFPATEPYTVRFVHVETGAESPPCTVRETMDLVAPFEPPGSYRLIAERDRRKEAMSETMTREEAISHIWGLSLSVEGEFCVGKGESDALAAETRAALMALGVSTAEIDADAS